MISIGYALFEELIRQEARRMKGSDIPAERNIRIEIPGDSFIPSSYIPDVSDRVRIYRSVWQVSSEAEIDEWIESLTDRFGEPEESVLNCAERARMAHLAAGSGIEEVVISGVTARIVFSPGMEVPASAPDNLSIKVNVEKTGRIIVTIRFRELTDREKVKRTLKLLRFFNS